jgi:hypothetical protein
MRSKSPIALALTAILLFGGVACGDDKDTTETEETETGHQVVPDATVTQGLAATQQLLNDIASGKTTDKDKALDAVEASWASYEGTIKQKEVELYLAFEDTLAAMQKAVKAANNADMTTAATKFATTAQTYLAKHPG